MSQAHSLGRSMLLTAIVAVGIAIVWCFVAAWTIGLVQQAAHGGRPVESLYVRLDGTPVIVRYNPFDYLASQQLESLDGEPLQGDLQQLLSPLYLYTPQHYGGVQASVWTSRLAGANDGGLPPIYWYLVHDGRVNGHAYGVGYHSTTKHIEGYFGKQGFSPTLPPRDQWFQVFGEQGLAHLTNGLTSSEPIWSQNRNLVLLADGKLWQIDLAKREVKAMLDCPAAIAIGMAYALLDELPETKELPTVARRSAHEWVEQRLLVREPENLRLLDQGTGKQTVVPLPPDFRHDSLAGFELADGRMLLTSFGTRRGEGGYEIAWLDQQGKVTEQKHVRFTNQSIGANEPRLLAGLSAVVAPMPLGAVLTALTYPLQRVATGQSESYLAALGEGLAEMWPVLLLVFVIGGVAATAVWRRQRLYGLPHGAAWAVLVFVLGVPGWLAYRLHRTWPPLADCPSCRQPSPRHRTDCLECGAPFPPPLLKGIEIYA